MKPSAYRQFARLEREHWWFRGRRHVYLGLLRHALGAERPGRVLDVGAGMGGFLGSLHALAGELHCTEVDAAAVRACQARGFADCLRAEACALPYADESFDLVTLFDVLEHLDEDGEALAQAQRVLRPGGLVLVSVPAHPLLFSNNDVVAQHRRRYTRRGLARLLGASGLHALRLTYSNALLFPPIALFLLASRGLEVLGLARAGRERTNLSWRLPRFANELAYRAFSAELALARHANLPFGHSLLAIAQRRDVGLVPLEARVTRQRSPGVRSGVLSTAT